METKVLTMGAEMTEDEKYVREHWERADCFGTEGTRFIELNGDMWSVPGNWPTDEEAWSAAAEFTRTRLEQIRDVEEEIDWLKSLQHVTHMNAAIRTLRRAEEALAALKRGMK